MAEAYARAKASEAGLADLHIDSAGTLGIEGSPASDHAVTTVGEHEIPLSDHRSRGLTADDAAIYDLVIVMARKHRDVILRRYPQMAGRVRLLREWDSESRNDDGDDLEDPIGLSLEDYRATFDIIRRSIDAFVEDLCSKKAGP